MWLNRFELDISTARHSLKEISPSFDAVSQSLSPPSVCFRMCGVLNKELMDKEEVTVCIPQMSVFFLVEKNTIHQYILCFQLAVKALWEQR